MTFTHAVRTLTITLALGLAVAGCRNDSRNRGGAGPNAAASPTASPSPVPGGSAAPNPADGVVARLTGDDDSEVSPQLEQIVFAALQRDVDDTPLEGF